MDFLFFKWAFGSAVCVNAMILSDVPSLTTWKGGWMGGTILRNEWCMLVDPYKWEAWGSAGPLHILIWHVWLTTILRQINTSVTLLSPSSRARVGTMARVAVRKLGFIIPPYSAFVVVPATTFLSTMFIWWLFLGHPRLWIHLVKASTVWNDSFHCIVFYYTKLYIDVHLYLHTLVGRYASG